MHAYIIRRLLIGVFVIWGVYTLAFFAVNLAPGDPFTARESAKVDEESLDRLRHQWGYDLPVIERYFLHIRRMFWADPEQIESEGAGVQFSVFGEEGQNHVRAALQEPPDAVVLTPTRHSVLDWGSEVVRLARQADGTYERKPIKEGKYLLGIRRISVAEADNQLDTAGVVIQYSRGFVTATPSRTAVPESIVLQPETGADDGPLTLARNPDGRTYGPAVLPAGRYTYAGGRAEVRSPDDVLDDGGLTFDLGTSIMHSEPVVSYLAPKLWATLKLAFWSLVLNFLVGITLGVISAVRKDTRSDHAIMVGAFFLYSMPGFWMAVMLQLIFSVQLGWLPLHGMGDGTFVDSLKHFAMPVFVLGIASAAGTARYQRSAVLEVLSQDYVRTARAKGLDERTVIWKHVMRNSLLPIITLLGLSLPFLVSGAVITESIFTWPGIGTAAIEAIRGRGVFVITAITLMATTMVIVGNLLADILYAVVDPRVRLK